jgi:hypothetical protein
MAGSKCIEITDAGISGIGNPALRIYHLFIQPDTVKRRKNIKFITKPHKKSSPRQRCCGLHRSRAIALLLNVAPQLVIPT